MSVEVDVQDDSIVVTTGTYQWRWSAADDVMTLRDATGRVMAQGAMQPVVIVNREGEDWFALQGSPRAGAVEDDTVRIGYQDVNGDGAIELSWRFEPDWFWVSPVTYQSPTAESIVRVQLFARWQEGAAVPTLASTYHVIPGLSMNAGLSPVVSAESFYRFTIGIGSRSYQSGLHQQWALPVHFFCGFHRNSPPNAIGSMTDLLSDAFCCGYAELAEGDGWLRLERDSVSPITNIRSDLWGHRQGPGAFTLGPSMVFTIAPTYHEAIRSYYRTLIETGRVNVRGADGSPHRDRVLLTSQFNSWGAQQARDMRPWEFDSASLATIYDEFRQSGMAAGMFVIDDKWEGEYGRLEHDPVRFPEFEAQLERIRDDGYLVGLWAAFLRCDDPRALGLTLDHVLRRKDGTPFQLGGRDHRYYIFDFTQPMVQQVLRETAQRFMRRYRPDLVKFDFGYELPSLEEAAPHDLTWSGERLLEKGLEVILGAMREVNPDLVVMYYGLSPLLAQFYDLHSPDDMCFNPGEYDLEANRRFFFSGLCGEFGMPTYSSSGYDWASATSIWFDGAALGPMGSLHDFNGDERGGCPSPTILARYNGVAAVHRPTTAFSIEPLEVSYARAALGATARSWIRREQGNLTLAALRPPLAGGPAIVNAAVSTTAQLVIASMDDQPLGQTSALGIVPFSDGRVEITLPAAPPAVTAVSHLFDGTTRVNQLAPAGGIVSLDLRTATDDGIEIEWIGLTAGQQVDQ